MESQASIQKLVKSIKPAQSLFRLKDKKPHFIDNLHITVARKLQPWQFEEGWLEYSNRYFAGKFIVKSMTLLRKYEGMKYQAVGSFGFMNMPIVTTQGALF